MLYQGTASGARTAKRKVVGHSRSEKLPERPEIASRYSFLSVRQDLHVEGEMSRKTATTVGINCFYTRLSCHCFPMLRKMASLRLAKHPSQRLDPAVLVSDLLEDMWLPFFLAQEFHPTVR